MPSVILLPESIVIPIVDGLTPESSSVTVHVIVGLLLTSVADAVGFVTVITGATFSLTVNRRNYRLRNLLHLWWSRFQHRPLP